MLGKILLVQAMIATSSLVQAEQTPAIHIQYHTGQKVTEFAVQLSGVVLAPNTYWEAIGFNGGYCGMQTGRGSSTKILFSMWHSKNGKARIARKNPDVSDGGFGGEGTGVKTIVDSSGWFTKGATKALAKWMPRMPYTFHVQSKPYRGGGTEITLYIWKPELQIWTFFSSLVRADYPGDGMTGYMAGLNSFLEDFSGNAQQRVGEVHGAWYKTQFGGAWETVKSINSGHGTERGSMFHYVQPVQRGSYQSLRYSTGGSRSDGYPNQMYNGSMNFKPPAPELNSVPTFQGRRRRLGKGQ